MNGQTGTTTPTNPADAYFANVTPQSATDAQSSYNTAQGAANTSAETDLTLPQMLQASFTNAETNNNPTIAKQGTDTANYEQVLANAGKSPQTFSINGENVPLGPDAVMTGMTDAEKNAAAPLNADNLSLALQNSGVLNAINLIAASHARDTQKLTDTAQTAYNNWQTTLSALSQKANLALGYSQLGATYQQLSQQQKQFEQSLAFQKQQFGQSPTQQALKLPTQVQSDAKTTGNFDAFASKWLNNPAYTAGGGNAQNLYDVWSNAHPGQTPTDEALLKYGLKTGKPLNEAGAYLRQVGGNLKPPNLLEFIQGLAGPIGGELNNINKATGWSL